MLAQVERRIEAEDWNGATPEDLVGLYAVLHAGVYGVSPIEEVAPVWLAAVSAAKRLTLEAFDGSPRLAVEFLRWIWGREIEREQWRQKHTGGRGKRLTWRHVFLWRESLVEWRIEEQRRNGPK